MQTVNAKIVGAFVLGAILLVIAGIITFGGGRLFQRTVPVVMNFQGSVGGLQIGSPITFRGVQIGRVTDVDLRYDLASGNFRIPVSGELRPDNLEFIGTPEQQAAVGLGIGTNQLLRQLIERGFRAQLSLPNFITKQVTVEVDLFPGMPTMVAQTDSHGRLEIPTIQSPFQEVAATLQTVFNKLQQLPLDEMISEGRQLLSGATQLVNDPRLDQIIDNVDAAVTNAKTALAAIDGTITPLLTNVDQVSGGARSTIAEASRRLAETKRTIEQLDQTLASAQLTFGRADKLVQTTNSLIEPGSPLIYELTSTLREVGSTMRSIRAFTSTLERQPNAVIFGRQLQQEGAQQ